MTDLLSIGSSGINVYQRALSTVSNNIANLNTEGYSRQTTEIDQNEPQAAGRGFIGTGAYFNRVARQYDSFLEQSLQRATADLESQQANAEYTARLLDFLGDDDIGLVSALNKFFSSAQQMSTDPASSAYRSTMLRSSEELATRINSLAEQLNDLGDQAFSAMEAEAESLNALATQLASLNSQLLKKRSEQNQPPALLDRRDQLLRDLSEYAGITTKINSQGLVSVSLSGSTSKGFLVDGLDVKTLSVSRDPKAPESVNFALNGQGGVEPLSTISSGSIAGFNNFLASSLKQSKLSLNDLVRVFSDEINAIQTAGLDLNGDVGEPLFEIVPSISVDQSNVRGSLQVQTHALDGVVPEFEALSISYNSTTSEWSAVDPASGQVVSDQGTGRLTIANISMVITGAPEDGDRLLVSSTSAAAQGLRVKIETGDQIAAASLFRVTPSETNRGGAVSIVDFDEANTLSGYATIEAEGSYKASEYAPIGTISAGQSEVVLELDPASGSAASLNLFTRDGRQILGSPSAVNDYASFISQNDFFYEGSSYSADYLNQKSASDGSYKDFDIEYGAFADPDDITRLVPLSGFGFNESSAIDFADGYLEFTVQSPGSNTGLNFQTVDQAITASGSVSVVGDTVYLGNGTTAEAIATVSYPYGAVTSGPARLRVDFIDEQFENASFEADAVGSTTITGWSVITDQIILGQTEIAGVLSPLDPSYPAGNLLTDTGGASPVLGTRTATVISGGSDGEGQALQLKSTNQTSNANGIIRSPAVVSDTVAAVSAGDTISFDWKATGSGDAYDAFGYFINETTGDTHIVLNQTGASASTSTDWATVEFEVPDAGDYRFVFVSGSYDASGGSALGGELLLDNIQINRLQPKLNPGVVDQIARKLVVTDDRNLIGANHPYNGDLVIEAVDQNGAVRLSTDLTFDSNTLIASGFVDTSNQIRSASIRSDRLPIVTTPTVIAGGKLSINGTELGDLNVGASSVEGFGALSALDVKDWILDAGVTGVSVETTNEIRVESANLQLSGPGLTINNVSVVSLNSQTATSFSNINDVMQSINAVVGSTGVEAAIDPTGALILKNANGEGANIRLGAAVDTSTNLLGRANGVVTGQFTIRQDGSSDSTLLVSIEDEGLPSDLNILGLNTQVRIRGDLDEEIGVFLNGGEAEVKASLQSSGIGIADGLRQRTYEVQVTDAGTIEFHDRSTDTLLATRAYNNETVIEYQGISIQLRAPAQAGDTFVIDGNNTGSGQSFDAQGNNSNLMRVVDLERQAIFNGLTMTDAYLGIVGDVGNKATQAEISVDALQILKDQATEARDRVSGVSLDQEAADLIRFQQAYQASAQVMQVATKLFDAILQVR